MVEGPGCKIKGENIRQKLKGRRLLKIAAKQVLQNGSQASVGKKQLQCDQLAGRTLDEILTLGKELFMIFGDLCLRIHFLMNGSHRIAESTSSSNDKKEEPVLVVDFQQTVLIFYQSGYDVRPAQPCLDRYEQMKDVDICSPFFNQKKVVAMVAEQRGRQLCDILLDQNIMPGVGNIIKNEALFDSGINPCMLVDKLKTAHVSHIVKMTRDFTMIFYKCRKTGAPLNKYYKIYARDICKSCGTKVTKTRMGDDSGRVTYFCSLCQTSDTTKLDKLTLPSKNSLLSWATSAVNCTESDWSCPACTLVNSPNHLTCNACLGPKPEQSEKATQNNIDVTKEYDTRQQKTVLSVSATKSNIINPKQPIKGTETSTHKKNQLSQLGSKRKSMDTPDGHSLGVKSKKAKTTEPELANNPVEVELTSKFPKCSGHKQTCSIWQTHKPGPNKNRWFFTCPIKGKKKCNYFEWSDKRFPVCPGHSKTCGYHTVLKLGANNGRKFFSCSLPKKEQCQYFLWAEGFGDCGSNS